MRKIFCLLCCALAALTTGCTVQEPAVNPEVGGFAVIDFTAKRTLAAGQPVEKPTHAHS